MGYTPLPHPQQMKRLPHKLINRIWQGLHGLGLPHIGLDENALLAEARKQTGLNDFGDDGFIEPFRRLLTALNNDSVTNPLGEFFTQQNVLRLLKNRLLAEDYFKRYPEILQRQLPPPLAVVGLARSGTTRTHRLLASDEQFLHLRSWESVYPAPFAKSFDAKRDPRHVEIDYGLRAVNYLMPHMKAVHPMGVDEVEEEVGLIQHGFVTSLFAAMNIVPSYYDWYIEQSADDAYAYMVKLLKLISWFRKDDPEKPWILKTPEHMVNFAALMRCFPDAMIVSTHRDPLAVLSSLSSMGWSALVRDYDEIDTIALGQQWKKFHIDSIEEPKDLVEVAKYLTGHENIASKRWVYEQYDSMVGTVNMSTNDPTDAGIVNLKGSDKALAMTVDCNARMVNADPEEGCAMAVAEAARNIVCSGGIPSAITNCLNFGNPYNPEVYWQFVGAIKGMKKSCEKFNTPVTGGNVSFYNQSTVEGTEIPVFPTPTIGMLGVIEDKSHITSLGFKGKSDLIYMLGKSENNISSSEYLASYHRVKESPAPNFDLDFDPENSFFLNDRFSAIFLLKLLKMIIF